MIISFWEIRYLGISGAIPVPKVVNKSHINNKLKFTKIIAGRIDAGGGPDPAPGPGIAHTWCRGIVYYTFKDNNNQFLCYMP